jgi:hypothetical protein
LSFFGLALEVVWCLLLLFGCPCWVEPGGTLAVSKQKSRLWGITRTLEKQFPLGTTSSWFCAIRITAWGIGIRALSIWVWCMDVI